MHKTACLLLLIASTAVAAPPISQDVRDARDAYLKPSECFPKNAEQEDEWMRSVGQLRAEAKRDFAAIRAYYKNDFIRRPPVGPAPTIQVVSPPPLCKTLEELKSDRDKKRIALDRLTRALVAHGVLPSDGIRRQAEK
jgi:hypothetical protein